MIQVNHQRFRALSSERATLAFVREVLDVHPDSGIVALIEDRAAARGLAIPVSGHDHGEGIRRLDDLILRAVSRGSPCRVVLASIRREAADVLDESDIERWREFQANHELAGVALLDWFIFTATSVISLGTRVGPRPRW